MIKKEFQRITIHSDGIRINNRYQHVPGAVPIKHILWEQIVAIYWRYRPEGQIPQFMMVLDSGKVMHLANKPSRDLFNWNETPTDQLIINEVVKKYKDYLLEAHNEVTHIRELHHRKMFISQIQIIIVRPGKLRMVGRILNSTYFPKRYFNFLFVLGLLLLPIASILTFLWEIFSHWGLLQILLLSVIFLISGYFANRYNIQLAIKQYLESAKIDGGRYHEFHGEPEISFIEMMKKTRIYRWFSREEQPWDLE